MKEELAAEFRFLGLEPAASRQQVEEAYIRKSALYAEDSLATYALFDEGERQSRLTRLDEAYRRIRTSHLDVVRRPAAEKEVKTKMGNMEPPDPAASPGPFLRAYRNQSGLTLKEIAERTKISSSYLAHIEEERFGALPAPVYLRGFVLAFARTLGVPDPEEVARRFMTRCRDFEQAAAPGSAAEG